MQPSAQVKIQENQNPMKFITYGYENLKQYGLKSYIQSIKTIFSF